ncbi:MAG: hypothetical protein ABSE63_02775 [Thermoguttaceae bacterium]|jgi:hypothetical protein
MEASVWAAIIAVAGAAQPVAEAAKPMDSSTYNIISLIIQGLVALGTMAVAIIAIWGEWLRPRPKLEIILDNPKGFVHGDTIFYHVKIINKRPWVTAKNVQVQCTAIAKKRPDGSFSQEQMLYPLPLIWAPAEFTGLESTFASEKLCDLGRVRNKSDEFSLAARYWWTQNYPGTVKADGAMRIRLYVQSHNFKSKKPFDIEISWDGTWLDNLEEMAKHLIIKEVKS